MSCQSNPPANESTGRCDRTASRSGPATTDRCGSWPSTSGAAYWPLDMVARGNPSRERRVGLPSRRTSVGSLPAMDGDGRELGARV